MYTQSFTPGVGWTVNPILPANGVLAYANLAAFPAVGVVGPTFMALDSDQAYYWDALAGAYVAFAGGGGGVLSPVDLTSTNTLTAADHAFRDVRFTGAAALQTMGAGVEGAIVELAHNGTGVLFFANLTVPPGARPYLLPNETGQVKYTGGAWKSLIFGEVIYEGGPITVPTDTSANVILTQQIAGGMLGPNGTLEMRLHFSRSAGAAGVCTVDEKLGGTSIGGTNNHAATQLNYVRRRNILNQGAQNAQVSWPRGNTEPLDGSSTIVKSTFTVDTSVNQDFTVTTTNVSSEAAITQRLEKWWLRIRYAA